MPDSNEPQQGHDGKQVVVPVSPDAEEIPLEDVEVPDEPRPDPFEPTAPPPRPPAEPIDEGSIAPDEPF